MKEDADELYKRLQAMYEIMQQTGGTEDVENAIFEYEDCVTDEDFENWKQKYSYFL